MSYTYDRRTSPREQNKKERLPAAEPGLRLNVMSPGHAAAPTGGGSRDLETAMQERMTRTFGDLSAVKNYQPPAQAKSPAPAGPYTGHVNHTVSAAAPSAFSAGVMQAKKYKDTNSAGRDYYKDDIVNEGAANYKDLDASKWTEITRTPTGLAWLFKKTKKFKARIKRKAYEMDPEELRKNRFNPNNVSALTDIQDKITKAGSGFKMKTPELQNGYNNLQAWYAFQQFNETEDDDLGTINEENARENKGIRERNKNKKNEMYKKLHNADTDKERDRIRALPQFQLEEEKDEGWNMTEVDNKAFTTKLKNMTRMVYDYPELNGQIGPLIRIDEDGRDQAKAEKNEKKAQTTIQNKDGSIRQKTPRKRAQKKIDPNKNTEPIKLPSMDGYVPNLNWQNDDAVDPIKKAEIQDQLDKEPKEEKGTTIMSAQFNSNYYDPEQNNQSLGSKISLNADVEGDNDRSRVRRQNMNKILSENYDTTLDYVANHELGHVLNYALIKEINKNKANRDDLNSEDMAYHITANRLVEQALKATMSEEDFAKLVRYGDNSLEDDETWDPNDKLEEGNEWATPGIEKMKGRFQKNQINLAASGLSGTDGQRGYTTAYGATNAAEFFAEAFADVYQNGKAARPTSIKLVQLYEEEMAKAKAANRK